MQQLMLILKKVDDFLSQAARIITAMAICGQMVIIFAGVIFRYFLKNPLMWSDELACYLLVFVTFFGSYVGLKDKALARITLVIVHLPPMLRRIVVMVSNLSTIFLLAMVAYFGIQLSRSPVVLNTVSPAMQLPTVIFYVILPITAFMMILHMLVVLYEDLHDKYEKEEQKEEYTCL